jgi:hypothetical protein
MASRRANYLNFFGHLSDDKFQIRDRADNANITGATFGWFRLDHSNSTSQFQIKMYADQDDADTICESAITATSSLPATVTLNETNSSGASGSIYIDGVS